jgi:hypothetical protein
MVQAKPLPPFRDPKRERAFQIWYAMQAKANGIDPNPDDPRHYYDYRRAFQAGANPGLDRHWPSTFKLAGHPNRYVDGIDTITGQTAPKGLLGVLQSFLGP